MRKDAACRRSFRSNVFERLKIITMTIKKYEIAVKVVLNFYYQVGTVVQLVQKSSVQEIGYVMAQVLCVTFVKQHLIILN